MYSGTTMAARPRRGAAMRAPLRAELCASHLAPHSAVPSVLAGALRLSSCSFSRRHGRGLMGHGGTRAPKRWHMGTPQASTGGYSIQYDSCNTCVSPGERPADRTGAAVHVHDCMFRLIIPLNNVNHSCFCSLTQCVCQRLAFSDSVRYHGMIGLRVRRFPPLAQGGQDVHKGPGAMVLWGCTLSENDHFLGAVSQRCTPSGALRAPARVSLVVQRDGE